MNEGKLDGVKQEMVRINPDILGISELNWVGMGEFNSDDIISITVYLFPPIQESQRINGVDLIINKRIQDAVLGCNIKNDRMISVHFQGKPFSITVIQLYVSTEDAEANQFYEDLEDLLELTPKKDVLFITGYRNAKVGSQEIPGITGKFGLGEQNETGQRLTEFCEENVLIIANTLFNNTSDDFIHGHHQMINTGNQTDYTVAQDGEAIHSPKRKQDLELTLAQSVSFSAKSRLKLKRAGKPTRPAGCDLNPL